MVELLVRLGRGWRGPAALLVGENLAVFWGHYFRGFGFPWDFVQGYYAMNAYSVGVLEHGSLPQWLPYQCMGYPYALNLQSGVYYPPLWLFALLHLPFTLRAATVLQCLTVLFGALGMLALLRRLLPSSWVYATVGASIFQFFGGFYSNAEHPDIIRSFALVPWLFLGASLDEGSPPGARWPRMLLPLFVYLMATGGYPGNLVATTFLLGVYVVVQLAERWRHGQPAAALARGGATLAVLFLLGLALACVHLGPAWFSRAQLVRATAHLRYRSLWVEHLPLLFFSSTPLAGEPSMSSTFLTIPGLLLVFFVSRQALVERWGWLVVLAVSALMVVGERSIVWRLVTTLAAPLRLSRFPSSDYRPLIALALVVVAALGLRSLRRGEIGRWNFLCRGALALATVATAGRALYGGWVARAVLFGELAAVATLGWLGWIVMRPRPARWMAAAAGLLLLIALDAARVLPDMETWHEPDIASLYQRRHWDTQERARDNFAAVPGPRPARQTVSNPHWYSWAGYLDARYMMADKAPCLLRGAALVARDSAREVFMLRPWTALILPPPQDPARKPLGLPPGTLEGVSDADLEPEGIRQTRYGADEISYLVSLARPALVVENEVYYPGWEASLDLAGGPRRVAAHEIDGVFRGWVLPAGRYIMTARFELPHLAAYRVTSLAALLVWMALIALAGPRRSPIS